MRALTSVRITGSNAFRLPRAPAAGAHASNDRHPWVLMWLRKPCLSEPVYGWALVRDGWLTSSLAKNTLLPHERFSLVT